MRGYLEHPRQFAEVWDAVTEAELTAWYREIVEEDRARIGEIEALRTRARARAGQGLVSRAAGACLTPLRETFANPGFVERILELAHDTDPPPLAGPNRNQLLQLLEGSPTA
jgi:hypothetical protein